MLIKLKFLLFILFYSIIITFVKAEEEKKEVEVNIKANYMLTFPDLEITIASDNVEVHYKDMEITCDFFEYDKKLDVFYAQGDITLKSGKDEIKGFSLKYDLKEKEGVVYQAEGKMDVFYFDTNLIDVTEEKGMFSESSATTCNLEKPHYKLFTKKLHIYPKDKAVAKKISFFVGKTKLFSFPYYVTSLKEEARKPFSPKIGYTKLDGFFIKTTYSYLFTPTLFGYLYLDWIEKKGTGLGFEQKLHNIKDGKATVYLYHFDKRQYQQTSLLSKVDYEQQFKKLNGRINANYSFDNQITFGLYETKVHNLNCNITQQLKNFNTTLTTNFRKSYGITLTQSNLNLISINNYKFYNNISLLLNYKENKIGNNYPDKELNTTLGLTKSYKRYNFAVEFNKREDIDNEKYPHDNYHILDKLPEVNITINYQPIIFKLFTCRYHEYRLLPPPYGYYKISIVKYEIGGDAKKIFKITNNSNITTTSSFYQNFYSNEDARYYNGVTLNINTRHTKYFNSQINYNFKNVEGYSPFEFDKIAKVNNTTGSLNFVVNKKCTLSLSSGYDFRTEKYNYLVSGLNLTPDKYLNITGEWEYDINNKEAKDLRTTTTLTKRDIYLKNFIIYDVDKGKLKRIDYDIKTKLGHWYELHYKTSYDAILEKFIYNDFLLTRDLHCWMMDIAYKEKTKELFFVLYIKAFPTKKVKLGVDERGQFYQDTFLNF